MLDSDKSTVRVIACNRVKNICFFYNWLTFICKWGTYMNVCSCICLVCFFRRLAIELVVVSVGTPSTIANSFIFLTWKRYLALKCRQHFLQPPFFWLPAAFLPLPLCCSRRRRRRRKENNQILSTGGGKRRQQIKFIQQS